MSLNLPLQELAELAIKAGELIMYYYDSGRLEQQQKADKSPVTIADKKSSEMIVDWLSKRFPEIPIISEENDTEQNLRLANSEKLFWLIDPLDGTWSYIRRRGVFTVNIALVKDGLPIYGVIHSPLHQSTYYTDGEGVTKLSNFGKQSIAGFSDQSKQVYDFLVSSKKSDPVETKFINGFQVCSITPVASSYKFCLLAEDRGDIYPRFKQTCIWDTAAGHALLRAVGGEVYDLEGNVLTYNRGSLENPNFVAYRLAEFKTKGLV